MPAHCFRCNLYIQKNSTILTICVVGETGGAEIVISQATAGNDVYSLIFVFCHDNVGAADTPKKLFFLFLISNYKRERARERISRKTSNFTVEKFIKGANYFVVCAVTEAGNFSFVLLWDGNLIQSVYLQSIFYEQCCDGPFVQGVIGMPFCCEEFGEIFVILL
jgi:hypothetical protein